MSIFDILVDQISSILGISREEILSRFTKEQLDEILNNSLCTPVDDYAIPFNPIESLPCDEPTPQFLPEIELNLDEINKKIEEKQKENPTKCVDSVKEVNKKVAEKTKKYSNYKILLTKLIEYQDTIAPLKYYFTAKINEASRVLNLFEPLLIEIKRLEELEKSISDESALTISNAFKARNDGNEELFDALSLKSRELSNSLIKVRNDKTNVIISIVRTEETLEVFNSTAYAELKNYRASRSTDRVALSQILGKFFSGSPLSSIYNTFKGQVAQYSSTVTLDDINTPTTFEQAIAGNYINFTVKFPNLDSIPVDEEKYDESTGNKNIEKINFKIKESPLLNKNSFFKSIKRFNVAQRLEQSFPSGRLYERYYNLFEDPINNFFTLEERGLTQNESEIDSKLKGGNFETKKEGASEYFIKDIEKVQNFYKDFEERLEARTAEVKQRELLPIQEGMRLSIESFAQIEIQTLLAIGGVSIKLKSESGELRSVLESLNQENLAFSQIYAELDLEISRIKSLLPELKPNQENVKKLLKEENPECFEKIDTRPDSCPDVFEKLGSDPLGLNSLGGIDSTLPTQIQYCYWVEFSKILNLLGLMPVPNLPTVIQLRYWPVGLTIPAPNGLIKIPLPIIYIPLVVISTGAGLFVLFLTVNGIFISPMLFFSSNSGYKQFIATAKGPSEKFGYDSQDDPIKLSILTTAAIQAVLEQAKKLALTIIFGKNYHLTLQDREDLERSKAILRRKIADPKLQNTLKKKRAERELKNLEFAEQNLGGFELFQKVIDGFESPDDIVSDLRKFIIASINKLGKPRLNKSNRLKDDIKRKKEKKREELKKALVDGDEEKAKTIRQTINEDFITISEKIEAIKADFFEYFDKLKLPVIRIPKNSRAIDPKLNAIFEIINIIQEFLQTSGSQFFSQYDLKLKTVLFKYLAKAKEDIDAEIDGFLGPNGKIDLDGELNKFQEALNSVSAIVLERIFGKKTDKEIEKSAKQIIELQTKLDAEQDPIKRKLLDLQIKRLGLEQNKLGDFMLNFSKGALNTINDLQFSQLTIDLNPYSPCCKKKVFSLSAELNEISLVLEAAKQFLSTIIQSIDSVKAINLAGGRRFISVSDIKAIYGGLLMGLPEQIVLPIPVFDLQKALTYFSNLVLPLFEPKAPIEAAQPALPAGLVIDLNFLKAPLLNLLIEYITKLISNIVEEPFPQLPTQKDPFTSSLNLTVNQDAFGFENQDNNSTGTQGTGRGRTNNVSTGSNIDPNIQIDGCYDYSQEEKTDFLSTQQNPTLDSNQQASPTTALNSRPDPTAPPVRNSPRNSDGRQSTIRPYRVSNTDTSLDFDIHPVLQNIALRFSDFNSNDVVSILKTFFDFQLDEIAKLLNGFYTAIKLIKHTKEENINTVEYAQNKVPPYGPQNDARFFLITTLKKAIPDSVLFKFVDLAKLEASKLLVEQFLKPVSESPLPILLVAGAGALDSALPTIKLPQVDPTLGTINTIDLKVSKMALRALHPILNQDDLPPWERLTYKNILFLLFLDEFASTAANQTGFFREFL